MSAAVYDARPCALGEGLLWHPERGQLFWFDILGKRLLGRSGATPQEWQFGEHVSAAGWVDRDTLLIASETGLFRFDIATGARSLVCPLEAENPATRSNDGRADPQGGFWIGTMGKGAEPGAGALYRFYKGALAPIRRALTIPNSICFSPDGRSAYYTDTPTRQILRQPLDAEGWPTGSAELFVDLSAERLNPDGSVVDAEGALWNAQWGAGRVARYLPDGSFDRAVAVGGRNASCPAFGGADLSTLFVTTARQGLKNPDAAQGCTYQVPAGTKGQAEHRVIL